MVDQTVPVSVEQVDRDNAADYGRALSAVSRGEAAAIRAGEWDDTTRVIWFAQRRLTHHTAERLAAQGAREAALREAYVVGFKDGGDGDYNPDTFISRALLAQALDAAQETQDWTGGRAWPEMLEAVAQYWSEWEENRAGRGTYTAEELAENAGEFATGLADHMLAQAPDAAQGSGCSSCDEYGRELQHAEYVIETFRKWADAAQGVPSPDAIRAAAFEEATQIAAKIADMLKWDQQSRCTADTIAAAIRARAIGEGGSR